jgi:starch phosphorylase
MNNLGHHFPYLPERLKRLGDIAYNLWFCWNSDALWLFRHLDRKLWDDVYHNPVRLLHEIDPKSLDRATMENDFIERYDCVIGEFDRYMKAEDTWYHQGYPVRKGPIAYFRMEFGFHECLPLYSGGLGILAGDHLKTASDLGIPLVGVGLLYRESYFTQFVTQQGHQQAVYIHNDFSNLALTPVEDENGDVLVIRVNLDHRILSAKVWKVFIGRNVLYLLDTDFPENPPEDRTITERLYVSDRDKRLIQEMLLGIGGMDLLYFLGKVPVVLHMNEGHCSFAALEWVRILTQEGMPVREAKHKVQNSTVFTTHTPVPAGNEVFEAERIDRYLQSYWKSVRVPRNEFMKLALDPANPDPNAFNMTALALRMSKTANGVSELHGDVARKMWQGMWPGRPVEEVPIGSITNGVHVHTWLASQIKTLLDVHVGVGWRDHLIDPLFWKDLARIPDGELWSVHMELKTILFDRIRRRLVRQRERNGDSKEAIDEVARILDPQALTIGFARRFAMYKRATLIFRDRERLKRIINRDDCPVQIVFAGKAHPADQPGKALIQQIYGESRNPEFRNRIVFVEDYDMAFARRLVSGVDVWLNTPRRPMEASGTSGMKVAINGGINFSILDGWWREGYNEKNGWAIGEDREYYNEFEQDEADSQSLYRVLEEQIIPLYYEINRMGLPKKWIKKMKESMKTLIPRFSTDRMLEEYVEQVYEPTMKG